MLRLRYINKIYKIMENIIPLFGMLIGVIIPVSVFYWQYKEGKDKNKTIIEISKHLDDSSKLEELPLFV